MTTHEQLSWLAPASSRTAKASIRPPVSAPVGADQRQMLHLQRSAGNAAVQTLLSGAALQRDEETPAAADPGAAPAGLDGQSSDGGQGSPMATADETPVVE